MKNTNICELSPEAFVETYNTAFFENYNVKSVYAIIEAFQATGLFLDRKAPIHTGYFYFIDDDDPNKRTGWFVCIIGKRLVGVCLGEFTGK